MVDISPRVFPSGTLPRNRPQNHLPSADLNLPSNPLPIARTLREGLAFLNFQNLGFTLLNASISPAKNPYQFAANP